jgi:hypothetical protein
VVISSKPTSAQGRQESVPVHPFRLPRNSIAIGGRASVAFPTSQPDRSARKFSRSRTPYTGERVKAISLMVSRFEVVG